MVLVENEDDKQINFIKIYLSIIKVIELEQLVN